MLEHYLYGDTELEVTSLESHLAKLYAPSPGAGCGGMESEFKVCVYVSVCGFVWALACFLFFSFFSFQRINYESIQIFEKVACIVACFVIY